MKCIQSNFSMELKHISLDRLAAKLARKESLSQKLQQRPGRQELIDRNILYQVTEEERKVDRSIIGAKLIRRLSLRPTPEELEERNILKSNSFFLIFPFILKSLILLNYPFFQSIIRIYHFPLFFVLTLYKGWIVHFRKRRWTSEIRSWRKEKVPASKT